MPDSSNSEARKDIIPLVQVGQPISAQKWNQLSRAISDPLKGVNGGAQTTNGSPLAIYQCIIIANDNGNYLTCVFWDSFNQEAGNDLFAVSKPYIMQQATLDGITDSNGIKYTFTGIDALTALDTGSSVSEDWVINFPYTIGEVIYVFGNVNGGIDNDFSVDYIDSNNAGRAWAKVPT